MKRLEIKDDGVYFKGRKLFFADELDLSGKADVDLSNITVNTDKCEIVYDMSSTDSTLNWGYTSGIQGSVSVSGKDFSKYKKLRYYCSRYGFVSIGIIDLEGVQRQEAYRSKSTQADVESSTNYVTTFTVSVNSEKTSFKVDSVYQNTGGKNNNTGYYIYKIEGVY